MTSFFSAVSFRPAHVAQSVASGSRPWRACFWTLTVASSLQASAADVYVASAADESYSYANQPLDASYRLLWRGPSTLPDSSVNLALPPRPMAARDSGREARRRALWPLVTSASRAYQVPEALVMAVIETESDFKTTSVSPMGARGLMQLMPATGRQYGLNRSSEFHDPQRNIDAGVRHLRELLRQAGDNTALALARYNAGSGKVARHGERIPPFRETMIYVPTVLARAAAYQQLLQDAQQ